VWLWTKYVPPPLYNGLRIFPLRLPPVPFWR
jgi:hypothetical protein